MGVLVPLFVKDVHLYEEENAKLHHTDKFKLVTAEPATPVLRRGQPFKMTIRFDRSFDIATDIIRFSVSFGRNTNSLGGIGAVRTLFNEPTDTVNSKDWSVHMIASRAEDLTVEVNSPADSPVGIWKLEIQTALKNIEARNNYRLDKDIYLLFNPWVKEDDVYMEDQILLKEYISSDFGKIWVGNSSQAWIFGQFEACILPACELMLKRCGIKQKARGDPIKMSRAISRAVNHQDDGGVIVGNWEDDEIAFSDGTHPSGWTGSVPILEQFLTTKRSVKYGQCWVFAGVVNTVLRALGIPSRVVTTLNSAHDSNASLSIDRYFDANHKEVHDPFAKGDSVWNFHVWNDAWMARQDLPKGYGGWQAIDATPQERFDGIYQCGPASVEAIRQGAVGFNYEVPFVLAAVNADIIYWIKDETSDFRWKRMQIDQKGVGHTILTKVPLKYDPDGDTDRQNIVSQYKSIEGSTEERAVLYRAARDLDSARRSYSIPPPNEETVKFELIPLEKVQMGDSFTVTVNIYNKSSRRQTIAATLSAESFYYNGVKGHLVKSEPVTCSLQPGEREVLRLVVTADEYLDKLVEYSHLKLRAIAIVNETRQAWASEDDFQILKPDIVIKVSDDLMVGEPVTVSLSFENPLKKTLTECKFYIASSDSNKNKILPFKNAAPGERVHVKYVFIPQKTGNHKIIAQFTSKQLVNIKGSLPIKVFEKVQ